MQMFVHSIYNIMSAYHLCDYIPMYVCIHVGPPSQDQKQRLEGFEECFKQYKVKIEELEALPVAVSCPSSILVAFSQWYCLTEGYTGVDPKTERRKLDAEKGEPHSPSFARIPRHLAYLKGNLTKRNGCLARPASLGSLGALPL